MATIRDLEMKVLIRFCSDQMVLNNQGTKMETIELLLLIRADTLSIHIINRIRLIIINNSRLPINTITVILTLQLSVEITCRGQLSNQTSTVLVDSHKILLLEIRTKVMYQDIHLKGILLKNIQSITANRLKNTIAEANNPELMNGWESTE